MGIEKSLLPLLGYHLYSFRMDYRLTEAEMLSLLLNLMETRQFKMEYRRNG